MTNRTGGVNWYAVLGLTVLFLSGLFDALALRRKDFAVATWFMGLLGLAGWIFSGETVIPAWTAPLVFVSLFILLVAYYRRKQQE